MENKNEVLMEVKDSIIKLEFSIGERGEKGEQGIPGEKGEKGEKGEQGERGEAGVVEVIHTTYSELVALKNSSSLKPNTEYAIMDYCFTSNQNGQIPMTNKGGFAVVVRTNENGELKHKARAMYGTLTEENSFDQRGIERWELMYDIENDTSKYAWADEATGKGVVYYLRDEWNNEAYFDFKTLAISMQGLAISIFITYNDPTIDISSNGVAYNNKILTTASLKQIPLLMLITAPSSAGMGEERMHDNIFKDVSGFSPINIANSICENVAGQFADIENVYFKNLNVAEIGMEAVRDSQIINVEGVNTFSNVANCRFVNGANLDCRYVSDVVLDTFSVVFMEFSSNIRNRASSVLLENIMINNSNNILLEACSRVTITESRNLELHLISGCSISYSENIRENNGGVSVINSTGVEAKDSISCQVHDSVNMKITGCFDNIFSECFNFNVLGNNIKMTNCRGGGKIEFNGGYAEFANVDGQIQLKSAGDVFVQNVTGSVILPSVKLNEECSIQDTKSVRILEGENIGRIEIRDCGDVVVGELQNGLELTDCGDVKIWDADNVDLGDFPRGVTSDRITNFSCNGRYGGRYSLEAYGSDMNIELTEYLDRDDSGFVEELYFVDWKIDEEGKVYKIENNKWIEVTKG